MRCYLEITNLCNLNCVFCPKNRREKRRLSVQEFDVLTDKLRGRVRFLYFHLMGEPFLHPDLPKFVTMAKAKGFVPILTTNGTLFAREGRLLPQAEKVLGTVPYKYQISLHSHEGNGKSDLSAYIAEVMAFATAAAGKGSIVVLRLWNEGGHDTTNADVVSEMAKAVPQPWTQRPDGYKLAPNLYLEYDRMFEWPDEAPIETAATAEAESPIETAAATNVFCYALRNQIGVLVDGSVVPCCLDHEGSVTLGNLFTQTLDEILQSPRARNIFEGFTRHEAVEPLCQTCGYATKTKQFREK